MHLTTDDITKSRHYVLADVPRAHGIPAHEPKGPHNPFVCDGFAGYNNH
jgi:hypothetical protein